MYRAWTIYNNLYRLTMDTFYQHQIHNQHGLKQANDPGPPPGWDIQSVLLRNFLKQGNWTRHLVPRKYYHGGSLYCLWCHSSWVGRELRPDGYCQKRWQIAVGIRRRIKYRRGNCHRQPDSRKQYPRRFYRSREIEHRHCDTFVRCMCHWSYFRNRILH